MPEAIRPGGQKNKTCFFYGTLMVPSVLTRVIYGTTRPEPYQTKDLRIRPAVLSDFVRRKVRYADYPGIVPEKGSTVRGTLVEGLTEWDMKRLDAFEGSEYKLGNVRVHVVGREAPVITSEGVINQDRDWKDPEGEADVEALTYIYSAGAHRLEPEPWDFNHFIKERLYLWAGDDSAEYAGESSELLENSTYFGCGAYEARELMARQKLISWLG
ncbi:hypothetical protein BJ508DRAFT_411364 [Ascobolus immersus RN42]|uniref:Putative gamma-glutamylcyclotransferase n=1 Tax=Ascobolus immersus RN42 TaxID=1160509 RepID=A0A3N4IPL7_ASCIM|nr:hypothetical protein BJ508DRAFT_411364 [Ascobolus immersus RN42]